MVVWVGLGWVKRSERCVALRLLLSISILFVGVVFMLVFLRYHGWVFFAPERGSWLVHRDSEMLWPRIVRAGS